ncbi:hypothetical protein [Sphingobacterium faecium]|jgi:hypothetical protein|uniref:hypothetical protein n=1 Tax=Sphingobacterium faecium TaxID=34087 RepID=UPI0004E5F9EF|nr:hypothetical protein [Sphingobacterium faecium]MQP29952.1 hypothetical protein [Sphingobacterium faecium]WGQ14307.1 hypothetical protein QG727_20050 [Sphingobacterium faecium]CDT29236.1 hypothetical protein BN1088_630007 [Sphingobacterium sp. PM2-P1-29]
MLKNDGFKEYENLDQRADFCRWFQDENSSRGFETKWAGAAASTWDDDQLLKKHNVINGSYWKLSNSSLNTLENSFKKNYFLSKFIPGPFV